MTAVQTEPLYIHTQKKNLTLNSLLVFLSGKKKMFSRICTTSLHFQVAFLQVCLQPCSGFLHLLLKYFLAVSFPAPHIREVWLPRCMAVQRQARRDSWVVSLIAPTKEFGLGSRSQKQALLTVLSGHSQDKEDVSRIMCRQAEVCLFRSRLGAAQTSL